MFCCLVKDNGDHAAAAILDEIARACSPRVQMDPDAGGAVVFDASGLDRAIGTPAEIGAAVQQLARDRGIGVRVAMARTATAAWLLAHAREGVTIAAGDPRPALAPLPIGWLAALPRSGPGAQASAPSHGPRPAADGQRARSPRDGSDDRPTVHGQRSRAGAASRGPARNYRLAPGPAATAPRPAESDERRLAAERDVVAIFERWGIRTLGDLARLPRGDIRARTGLAGLGLHQAACGEDTVPLVPDVDAARFVERLQLEWPIEGLEPLSFVLARMCDAVSRSLERADRGAIGLTTRLVLVSRETHTRTLHLPAPMRDARVLRTLILLDLESHPPPAGIDAVELELDAIAGRIVQGSLLARALPSSEDLATLIARLRALMGETHVGAPAIVDAHDDRAWTMRPFAPRSGARDGRRPMADSSAPVLALRRIRRPIPARVRLTRGLPVHVQPSSRAVSVGDVVARAGPWRSSGHWWSDATCWDREEWEIEIAGGGCYRLARTRGQWEVEGEID